MKTALYYQSSVRPLISLLRATRFGSFCSLIIDGECHCCVPEYNEFVEAQSKSKNNTHLARTCFVKEVRETCEITHAKREAVNITVKLGRLNHQK